MDDLELKARAARIESLVKAVEAFPEPEVRGTVAELLQGLLALYGCALERMLFLVGQRDPALSRALVEDELIAHLMVLHGLHPVPLTERVKAAADQLRATIEGQGGAMELLSIEADRIVVRLQGPPALQGRVERVIRQAAPEVNEVVVEQGSPPPVLIMPERRGRDELSLVVDSGSRGEGA